MARPNYRQRERIRARLKAMGEPCAICGKPIDYDLTTWIDPKDGKRKRHPLSFEYDHVVPYSVGKDADPYGVNSFDNAQAVHRICNQKKGGGYASRKLKGGHPRSGNSSGERRGCEDSANAMPTSRAW